MRKETQERMVRINRFRDFVKISKKPINELVAEFALNEGLSLRLVKEYLLLLKTTNQINYKNVNGELFVELL